MKYSNKGFSFIEILITCAILIVLATIGVTYSDNMKDKSNNSKVKTEISTLENSFVLYYDDVKTPILPSGNQKFFNKDSTYAHDSVGAFGVSGFATETTLPKKFMNYLPVDPKSNQYYAYATTFGSGEFEVAGIIKYNKNYQALVSGNYTGNNMIPNLIREYNGPNFVFNTSMDFLPYNPEERILTAKIHNFTGSVLINNTLYSKDELKDLDLFEGDTIKVGSGEFAEIFFSDGSQSTLGDSAADSELTLANMRFIEDTNISTQIKLALNVGSLWTKASKLSEKSQFEIYTIDSVAAVRGTVFGVRIINGKTNTVVLEGKVEVNKILSLAGGGVSFEDITDGISSGNPSFSTGSYGTPYIAILGTGNTIIVNKGEAAKGITTDPVIPISTGATLTLPTPESKEKIIENAGNINSNIQLTVLKLDIDNKTVEIELTPTLKTATKLILNETGSGAQNFFNGNSIIIPDLEQENIIKLCDTKNCTTELKLKLDTQVSYTKPEIEKIIAPPEDSQCNGIKAQGTCGKNLMGNDWEVTHFAPFDVEGDLNMYKKNESILFGTTHSGIIGNLCFFKYNHHSFPNIFYPEECESMSHSGGYLSNLIGFTNDFKLSNSWLDIKNGFKGIILDSYNNDDSLKYEFDPLDLSGSVAIEIQVRAEALKRNDGIHKYYLLDGGPWKKLYLDRFGKLKFNVDEIITDTGINLDGPVTIQLIQNGPKVDIKLIQNNSSIKTMSAGGNLASNYYYIGNSESNGSFYNQWNDVIDYVKIYKKLPE